MKTHIHTRTVKCFQIFAKLYKVISTLDIYLELKPSVMMYFFTQPTNIIWRPFRLLSEYSVKCWKCVDIDESETIPVFQYFRSLLLNGSFSWIMVSYEVDNGVIKTGLSCGCKCKLSVSNLLVTYTIFMFFFCEIWNVFNFFSFRTCCLISKIENLRLDFLIYHNV